MIQKPDVVLVTGSREWTDIDPIRRVLKPYRLKTILIHGACRGADTICANVGKAFGFTLWALPYFEDEDGEECRNRAMVKVASLFRDMGHKVNCYAFPLPGAIGTWKCHRLMEAAGFVPEVVRG